MNKKIIHLTSVHRRDDTRIFIKMCRTIIKAGYEVTLIVADGLGFERRNGIQIIDVGLKENSRLSRVTKTVWQVYKKAKSMQGDIYHLHDPELIPIGIILKKQGKKVIFDAHEDFPKQLLGKPYLSKTQKKLLSKLFKTIERFISPIFDAIVSATPPIKDKFKNFNPITVDVNNFPVSDEFENHSVWSEKLDEAVYVGAITKIRGIEEIVNAMAYTDGVRLNLVGDYGEKEIEKKITTLPSWSKVNSLGFLNRQQVKDVLIKSKLGLVTLYPTLNYLEALPVKMFEYMAAGIPVVASDFPLWKRIIEGQQCGLCVDPLAPRAIGEAIQYLVDNPRIAEEMGRNGKKAMVEKYNWNTEKFKLLNLYEDLLGPG